MPLSQSIVLELRKELARLEGARREIDGNIAAIRQLIGSGVQTDLLGETGTKQDHGPPRTLPQAALEADTFRDIVFSTIEHNPGIKTPEITRLLNAHSLKPQGNTDLGHRVYNECWRMLQQKRIRKTDNGGWAIAA